MSASHSGRAHSKYSASGSDRWFNCPGSVALSEGLPDTTNKWSGAGTRAHEILEAEMRLELLENSTESTKDLFKVLNHDFALGFTKAEHTEMLVHARNTARFIMKLAAKRGVPFHQIMVETRIHLDFIHPEMFGTFDSALVELYGTLHVFDFKYGQGYAVNPRKNLQMIFYGIGLAHKYDWKFNKVRLWIDQPRLKGYDGPIFWEVSIEELKSWVEVFRDKVIDVELNPDVYKEGSHCHFCKAKKICPLKVEKKLDAAKNIFMQSPIDIDGMDTQEFE